MHPSLDLPNISAVELTSLLSRGSLTSLELVQACLAQIDAHNHKGLCLNAVISTAPQGLLFDFAKRLDGERAAGRLRSPLHGIPIIVKDCFLTPSLKMKTTCGAYALRDVYGSEDAPLITKLLEAGLIIIGKANLTELGATKSIPSLPSGYSPVGGQTVSPYVKKPVKAGSKALDHDAPGGSSSGSGVAVAAGFAPLAVGTEEFGSTVGPGMRNALYAMKAPLDTVNMKGAEGGTSFICAGDFAKTPEDLALLMNVLSDVPLHLGDTTAKATVIAVGVVNFEDWLLPEALCDRDDAMESEALALANAAFDKLEAGGCTIKRKVTMPTYTNISNLAPNYAKGNLIGDVARNQWRDKFDSWLALCPDAPVHSLKELVAFNEVHPDQAMPEGYPNQDALLACLDDKEDQEVYKQLFKNGKRIAHETFTLACRDAGVKALIGPECELCGVAAMAGMAIGTLPTGFSKRNGRAVGLQVMAESPAVMLDVMRAWHALVPQGRKAPSM